VTCPFPSDGQPLFRCSISGRLACPKRWWQVSTPSHRPIPLVSHPSTRRRKTTSTTALTPVPSTREYVCARASCPSNDGEKCVALSLVKRAQNGAVESMASVRISCRTLRLFFLCSGYVSGIPCRSSPSPSCAAYSLGDGVQQSECMRSWDFAEH
jgi:hypothetical protein